MSSKLQEHEGEWVTLRYLIQHAKVVEEGETRKIVKPDLKEGRPIILGSSVWVIFLYDHVNLRYFIEHAFKAYRVGELEKAYDALLQRSF